MSKLPIVCEGDIVTIGGHKSVYQVPIINVSTEVKIKNTFKVVEDNKAQLVCPEHGLVTATIISTSKVLTKKGSLSRHGDQVLVCGCLSTVTAINRGVLSE